MKRLIIFSILASFIALSPLYGQQKNGSDKQLIEKIKKEEQKQKEKDKKEQEKQKQTLKKQKEKEKAEEKKQKEKQRKEATRQKEKDKKEQEKQKKEALKQKQSLKKNIQEVKQENKEQEKKQAQVAATNKKQDQLSEAQKEKLAEIKFLEELKKQEKLAKKEARESKKRQNKKNEPAQKVVPREVTRSNTKSSQLDKTESKAKTEAKSEIKTEAKTQIAIEPKKQSTTSVDNSKKQSLPQTNANEIVEKNSFNPKDSTYTFDFVANDSIFYISFKNNRHELQRLQDIIKQLDMDKYYISVKGYSNFSESKSESLQRAKFLSNQIKSRLIIINNVVEQDFKTYNSGGELVTYEQQRVVVTFIDATDKNKVTRPKKSDQELKDLFEKQNDKNILVNHTTNTKTQNTERQQVSSINEPIKDNNNVKATKNTKNSNTSQVKASERKPDKDAVNPIINLGEKIEQEDEQISDSTTSELEELVDSISNKKDDVKKNTPEVFFSLGTNLLAWATLIPNIDFEVRYERFSLNIDGSFAPWKSEKNGHNQYLAFWNVSPEFRYYLGANSVNYLKSYYTKGFYTGLFYNAGFFNIKRDIEGNQGFFHSFGVCGGYLMPLKQSISIDFGLCLGYNLLTIENYADEKDESGQMINYTIKTDKKGIFFPAKAKITIKWTPGAQSKKNFNNEE